MKRFLVFLAAAIVMVSIGLTIYYFSTDNELIYIKGGTLIHMNQGETIKANGLIGIDNPSNYTTIDYSNVKNTKVVNYNKSEKSYTAVAGGSTDVLITTSNKAYSSLKITIVVHDGTAEFPYIISTQADLEKIGQSTVGNDYTLSKHYMLGADIKVKGKWLPIGTTITEDNENFTASSSMFTGGFDGAGHKIANVDMTKYTLAEIQAAKTEVPGEDEEPSTYTPTDLSNAMEAYNKKIDAVSALGANSNAGLFGAIGENSYIKNLFIEDVNVYGNFANVGAIAAENRGHISTSEVTSGVIGSTRANARVGGIAGYNNFTGNSDNIKTANFPRIDRCANLAEVEQGASSQLIGGVVGLNKAGRVSESYFRGFLNQTTGDSTFGGIAGRNEFVLFSGKVYKADILDCFSSIRFKATEATFEEETPNIAGIVGSNLDNSDVNRIVGNHFSPIRYFNAEGPTLNFITGKSAIGSSNIGLGVNCTQMTFDQMAVKQNYESYRIQRDNYTVTWNFNEIWSLKVIEGNAYPILNYNSTTGSTYDFEISNIATSSDFDEHTTAQQMYDALSGDLTTVYGLSGDIDFAEYPSFKWYPIDGIFKGGIVGKKTVTDADTGALRYPKLLNLTIISNTSGSDVGMFRETLGATFRNITFENVTITHEGGAANRDNNLAVGVLAGYANETEVINVTINDLTVLINGDCFGGFFGIADGNPEEQARLIDIDIYNVKATTVYFDYAGGVVGNNQSKIAGSLDNGFCEVLNINIVARVVGGVVGYNDGGQIYLIDASMSLEQTREGNQKLYSLTAIAAYVAQTGEPYEISAGGIAGVNENGTITNVYSKANIKLDSASNVLVRIGGIAAYNKRSLASIGADILPKGLYGDVEIYNGGAYVYNSTLKTALNYEVRMGGIVGENSGTVQNSFVNKDVIISASMGTADANIGSYVGGIAGSTQSYSKLIRCANYADVQGFFAGGIVGMSLGNAQDCYAGSRADKVTVRGFMAGGIAALIVGRIDSNGNAQGGQYFRCYSIVKLEGASSVNQDVWKKWAKYNNNVDVNTMNVGVKAGIAVWVADGALMKDCYTVATFDKNGSGLNYSTTTSRCGLSKQADREKNRAGKLENVIYTTDEKSLDGGGKKLDLSDLMNSTGKIKNTGWTLIDWIGSSNELPRIDGLSIIHNNIIKK